MHLRSRLDLSWVPLRLGFLVLMCHLAAGQGAKLASSIEPPKQEEQDNPVRRAEWFSRGRSSGSDAAALRFRAVQQTQAMRTQRLKPAGANLQPLPRLNFAGSWTPLGPSPLASDATGLGGQD